MPEIKSQPQNNQTPPQQAHYKFPRWTWILILGLIFNVIALTVALATVQIRRQNLKLDFPKHEALKDSTADWKTYTNSQYGFEFKYPNDWLIQLDPDGVGFKQNGVNYEAETPLPLSIGFDSTKFNSIQSQGQNLSESSKKLEIEKLKKRLGVKVLADFIGDPPWGYYTVYIESPSANNSGFSFQAGIPNTDSKEYGGTDKDITTFNQILSTFKFTN